MFSSVQFSIVRLMLVGIWLGLYWVFFSFFDHYIQSSAISSHQVRLNPKFYAPLRSKCVSRRRTVASDFSDGIVAWLVANTKAVVPLTAHAGGRLGLVGTTRAAVYPMRKLCV